MKKLFLLLLALPLVFASCDKDGENVADYPALIVGSWKATDSEMVVTGDIRIAAVLKSMLKTEDAPEPGMEVEFTGDGQAISEGETTPYTIDGSVLYLDSGLGDGTTINWDIISLNDTTLVGRMDTSDVLNSLPDLVMDALALAIGDSAETVKTMLASVKVGYKVTFTKK